MSFAVSAKLFKIWLMTCIPKYPQAAHTVVTLLLQSLSPCSMPAMLWLLLLFDGAWCAITLFQITWRCRLEVKVQTHLPERRETCMKTRPGVVFLCCFPWLCRHDCCCCWGKLEDSLFCVPGTELLCEVPAGGTDSVCSHGRLCRHFALRLGAGEECCWFERREGSSGL